MALPRPAFLAFSCFVSLLGAFASGARIPHLFRGGFLEEPAEKLGLYFTQIDSDCVFSLPEGSIRIAMHDNFVAVTGSGDALLRMAVLSARDFEWIPTSESAVYPIDSFFVITKKPVCVHVARYLSDGLLCQKLSDEKFDASDLHAETNLALSELLVFRETVPWKMKPLEGELPLREIFSLQDLAISQQPSLLETFAPRSLSISVLFHGLAGLLAGQLVSGKRARWPADCIAIQSPAFTNEPRCVTVQGVLGKCVSIAKFVRLFYQDWGRSSLVLRAIFVLAADRLLETQECQDRVKQEIFRIALRERFGKTCPSINFEWLEIFHQRSDIDQSIPTVVSLLIETLDCRSTVPLPRIADILLGRDDRLLLKVFKELLRRVEIYHGDAESNIFADIPQLYKDEEEWDMLGESEDDVESAEREKDLACDLKQILESARERVAFVAEWHIQEALFEATRKVSPLLVVNYASLISKYGPVNARPIDSHLCTVSSCQATPLTLYERVRLRAMKLPMTQIYLDWLNSDTDGRRTLEKVVIALNPVCAAGLAEALGNEQPLLHQIPSDLSSRYRSEVKSLNLSRYDWFGNASKDPFGQLLGSSALADVSVEVVYSRSYYRSLSHGGLALYDTGSDKAGCYSFRLLPDSTFHLWNKECPMNVYHYHADKMTTEFVGPSGPSFKVVQFRVLPSDFSFFILASDDSSLSSTLIQLERTLSLPADLRDCLLSHPGLENVEAIYRFTVAKPTITATTN